MVDLRCEDKPCADLFAGARHIGFDRGVAGAVPDVVMDAMMLPLPDACDHRALVSVSTP